MTTPGWYRDPLDPEQTRYWDGQSWDAEPSAPPEQPDASPVAVPGPPAADLPAPFGAPASFPPPPGFGAPSVGPAPSPFAAPGTGVPGPGSPGTMPQPAALPQPGFGQPGPMPQPGALPQPGLGQPGVMQPGVMQPGAMQPGVMQPGAAPMHRYGATSVTRRGATTKGAWTAALAGLQASGPLLAGISSLLFGAMFANRFGSSPLSSNDPFDTGGITTRVLLIGLLELFFGVILFAGAVGAALGRSWAKGLLLLGEILSIIGVLWLTVGSGTVGSLLFILLPIVVLFLVLTDDGYA